jgi:UDP-GlcNAc3NAcA epimerase
MKQIVTILGTRPQYIKALPVSLAIARHPHLTEFVVDTGQHFDFEMSDIFMRELGLRPPDVNLGINSMSHARMTAAMLPPIEDILAERRPDIVLIYGDTNSSLAAALAAAKLEIPIAHVEGGIRTHAWHPEEVNRRVVDVVSDWIFCPTKSAFDHCQVEGLSDVAHNVGDVMYDTLLLAKQLPSSGAGVLDRLGLEAGGYVVTTIHRPENTESAAHLKQVLDYVRDQAAGTPIVFPAHPRVGALIESASVDMSGIMVTKPVGYLDMARLAASASAIFTDSGGLQKEAYFHDVPVTVMSNNTPWPVLHEAGRLKLWTDPDFGPRRPVDDFGDGQAASRIAALLGGDPAPSIPA